MNPHPARFGGNRQCGIEDIIVLVCHVILRDRKVSVKRLDG